MEYLYNLAYNSFSFVFFSEINQYQINLEALWKIEILRNKKLSWLEQHLCIFCKQHMLCDVNNKKVLFFHVQLIITLLMLQIIKQPYETNSEMKNSIGRKSNTSQRYKYDRSTKAICFSSRWFVSHFSLEKFNSIFHISEQPLSHHLLQSPHPPTYFVLDSEDSKRLRT